MKIRRLPIITSLALVALLISTGMVFAANEVVQQGRNNQATGDAATVSGGENNNASGDHSTISGGGGAGGVGPGNLELPGGNTASGDFATIGGGTSNRAEGFGSTVSGGGVTSSGPFILGSGNTANGEGSTIGGGSSNVAKADSDTIAGGSSNETDGGTDLVGGATVGGGFTNKATNTSATVGGGAGNSAEGRGSTVSGGGFFSHTAFRGIVGGNTASGETATVGGGRDNVASGLSSTIPGGRDNLAAGDYSFAAGHRAKANDNGAFVWADSTDADFSSTGENQFLIRASGGVGIDTNSPNQLLVVGDDLGGALPGNRITVGNTGTPGVDGRSGINLGEDLNHRAFILWNNDEDYLQLGVRNGSVQENDAVVVKNNRVGIGTANPAQRLHVNGNVLANNVSVPSSMKLKTDIKTLEGALAKVQDLRGVSFNWKADGKHDIGLIAEEVGEVVPEVVTYDENGKDAIAVDYSGLVPVLVEAVKEQQQLLEEKDAQITSLEARIAALEESVGVEAKDVQAGALPFINSSVMWMLAGGLGLLLVSPGLVLLGYRRIKRD